MAVVAALDADEPPPLGGMARALQRDVDRLAAARAEHRVLQAFGRHARASISASFGAHQRGEMVVADVEMVHALAHGGDDFRIAMAEASRCRR